MYPLLCGECHLYNDLCSKGEILRHLRYVRLPLMLTEGSIRRMTVNKLVILQVKYAHIMTYLCIFSDTDSC